MPTVCTVWCHHGQYKLANVQHVVYDCCQYTSAAIISVKTITTTKNNQHVYSWGGIRCTVVDLKTDNCGHAGGADQIYQ